MMKKVKLQTPHPFVILFIVMALITLATHFIPAGLYNRIVGADGRELVDPESFRLIESTPAGISDLLLAIPSGFSEAVDIISFTLFIGAGVAVINKIGLIPAAVESLAIKFQNKQFLVIPILMLAISFFNAVSGVDELSLLCVSILMPLILKLGFDSVTTIGLIFAASAAGFSAALFNPFTIAISQKIAGLPLYSGTGYRLVTFIVFTSVAIAYVMRYAVRVLKNPVISLTYEADLEKREKLTAEMETVTSGGKLNTRQKAAALFAGGAMVFMIYNLLKNGWDMPQMGACFLVIETGCGIIAGERLSDTCNTLLAGCNDMMFAALLIGIARGISVIMTNANILDTIVYYIANVLQHIPASITIVGIFLSVTILEIFISSGSGKAAVIFPILAPLSDLLHITRQTTVLAYQFGDGFTNYFWPTSGIMHACLGKAGVSYSKWLKFYVPLLVIFTILSIIFLLIAQNIQFGPF